MVIFFFFLLLVVFAVLRLVVVLVNYIYTPYLRPFELIDHGKILVVVGQGKNTASLVNLLHDLQNQSYTNFEVLVYCSSPLNSIPDDQLAFARVDNRFKFLNGTIREAGESYSSNFRNVLVEKSSGSYILFLDPDMRMGIHFINAMVANMKHRKLAVLSVTPHYDTTKSFGVKIAVSAVQWLMLSLIPLKLIGKHFNPKLPLTDGMPVMYNAEVFRRHTLTSVTIPEDLKRAMYSKEFKQLQLRSFTLLGRKEEISYSYFTSYRYALRRVAGGLFDFFSGREWLMFSYAILTTLGPFITLLAMPYPFTFAYLFSVLLGRMLVAALCEQSAWSAILLFPLQQLVLFRMMLSPLHSSITGHKR